MRKLNKLYGIERALEKLIKEIQVSIRRFTYYLTHIPKDKGTKMIMALEIISFTLLGLALILRLRGF